MASRQASSSSSREQSTGRSTTNTTSSSTNPSTSEDDGDTRVSRKPAKLASPPSSLSIEDSSSLANIASSQMSSSSPSIEDEQPSQNRAQQAAHGHRLPSGWACNYDPETDEYNFELVQQSQAKLGYMDGISSKDKGIMAKSPTMDHQVQTSRRPTFHLFECQYGYHFPSSPTASMISELAQQVQKSNQPGAASSKTASKSRQIGYGRTKLIVPSDEEEQSRRLRDMFPTATEPIIEQMIRIYHGREGLIKAALISLGYKRSNEYDARQAAAQSPVMLMMSKASSKKLFEKLVGYFPDRDENLIKSLMYKHKEVEHEVISALVEVGHRELKSSDRIGQAVLDRAKHDRGSRNKNGAIMKLRYLKVLYPTCEEIEIYHLLHCNDLNVHKVMEIIEKRGHKRANIEEVMQNRKSQTQQMRAQQAAHAAKDKPPSAAHDLVEAHKKRVKPSVAANRIDGLKGNLQKSFEDMKDGLLLAALEASDYNESLAKKFLDEMEPIVEAKFTQRYQMPQEEKPNVVAFPCKAIQKGEGNFMSIVSNECVYIDRSIIECDNALALLKVDVSTYTEEDFPKPKFTWAQGKRPNLMRGSQLVETIKQRIKERKAISQPEKPCLMQGSRYETFCSDLSRPRPNSSAIGRDISLARGVNTNLKLGHNPKLLQRSHPFFA